MKIFVRLTRMAKLKDFNETLWVFCFFKTRLRRNIRIRLDQLLWNPWVKQPVECIRNGQEQWPCVLARVSISSNTTSSTMSQKTTHRDPLQDSTFIKVHLHLEVYFSRIFPEPVSSIYFLKIYTVFWFQILGDLTGCIYPADNSLGLAIDDHHCLEAPYSSYCTYGVECEDIAFGIVRLCDGGCDGDGRDTINGGLANVFDGGAANVVSRMCTDYNSKEEQWADMFYANYNSGNLEDDNYDPVIFHFKLSWAYNTANSIEKLSKFSWKSIWPFCLIFVKKVSSIL